MDEYETMMLRDLPASLRGRSYLKHQPKKWAWMLESVKGITPQLPVARYRLPNKKECESAQSSINSTYKAAGGKRVRFLIAPAGYHYLTRTEPVASKDGEYFLYVKLEKDM
jgi:hypothetical protein